jgi:ribonuclease E
MPNKMLIDAAHPEETRVVVLRGNRVEEFDFESASRKQLRGNIYLAKVTRVEPSLQAAFVDYGGNRHGFLAFSEIHPDYYQIPVADRQALIEAEEAEIAEAEARDRSRESRRSAASRSEQPSVTAPGSEEGDEAQLSGDSSNGEMSSTETSAEHVVEHLDEQNGELAEVIHDDSAPASGEATATEAETASAEMSSESDSAGNADHHDDEDSGHVVSDDAVESVGAEDAMEEVPERRKPRLRQYKIQEVIKRRQVLLVQVVKEERGNKGAALTTYLSLAGRYSVLMPNTARGGGISRKITSITDRKRLKQVVSDLEVPPGMGVILRTAGASRTRAEVKRDFEYLIRLWETVRELTLKSTAPALVYEEGSLIKRSIRDLYNKDIDEVVVAGEESYREAKDFMRMLMPSHAKNVQPYREPQPLFARSGIEAQLDAMFSPQVTLKSGGYMVINQTEALVAIDVNSGRSTREHNIEDTALQTNLEAAEEVARQLRLRDLAGLIVIDFIDMEEKRNNRAVERKIKDALKNDRARIQVGRISHFGLLEMSRQRIRTGVLESTTTACPTCQGTGHIRAPASVALHVLRSLEDQLLKGVTHNLVIRTRTVVALYILNQKRATLAEIEQRFGLTITVAADETIANGAHFVIERGEPVEPRPTQPTPVMPVSVVPDIVDDIEETEEAFEEDAAEDQEEEAIDEAGSSGSEREHSERSGEQREGGRRRRRRRGRRGGSDRASESGERPPVRINGEAQAFAGGESDAEGEGESEGQERDFGAPQLGPDGQPRKRRRGRRGGRRGRRGRGGEGGEGAPQHQREGGAPRQVGEAPSPFQGNRFDAADDEIDTTPTLETREPRPAFEAPRPVDYLRDSPPDEIDTTPQPERRVEATSPAPVEDSAPRHAEVTQSGSTESAAEAEQPKEDPNRPKRSGWWQRKSFF